MLLTAFVRHNCKNKVTKYLNHQQGLRSQVDFQVTYYEQQATWLMFESSLSRKNRSVKFSTRIDLIHQQIYNSLQHANPSTYSTSTLRNSKFMFSLYHTPLHSNQKPLHFKFSCFLPWPYVKFVVSNSFLSIQSIITNMNQTSKNIEFQKVLIEQKC